MGPYLYSAPPPETGRGQIFKADLGNITPWLAGTKQIRRIRLSGIRCQSPAKVKRAFSPVPPFSSRWSSERAVKVGLENSRVRVTWSVTSVLDVDAEEEERKAALVGGRVWNPDRFSEPGEVASERRPMGDEHQYTTSPSKG
ncbi:hypothetical protein AXG93_2528s2330 [Marchantia polymorpha subsp. ruderalis]|uniref:Uncharacterized protein n=1 Tax=Marchantia polymorpha subsp. ruderalis TaxID=1480154 RepID=A0A176WPV7_MARPO|nr:hypothetical protein AXG93_2528s2330 [Marchantia polymorpha subsp. ruderalis]